MYTHNQQDIGVNIPQRVVIQWIINYFIELFERSDVQNGSSLLQSIKKKDVYNRKDSSRLLICPLFCLVVTGIKYLTYLIISSPQASELSPEQIMGK